MSAARAAAADDADVATQATSYFENRLEDIFRYHYYAKEPDSEDRLWSLHDMSLSEAPHRPVSLGYRGLLAHFRTIDQIAKHLFESPDYVRLNQRIDARVAVFSEEGRWRA